jgi:hypothetical protein
MAEKKKSVDKIRASRDGHEFHEAWTARKSMQLLMPDGDLKAIAVEGLSPVEQKSAAAHTIDIADLTFYYNGRPRFQDAARVTIAQFKYSIADEGNDFRASHAKKTIEKFAQTFTDYSKRFGADEVNKKLSFQLFTNQPVYQALYEAIDGIARGATLSGKAEKQAEQFKAASGVSGNALSAFASRLEIVGLTGSLSAINADLEGLVVDWSASTNDPIAEAHLGRLRKLVRDKAGSKGAGENLITRTDILGALNIDDEANLVPCKTALINVGKVLPREQLAGAVSLIPAMTKPLMVHASGGVGKTVFMDSLAKASQKECEVVFFDCFGLGSYRSPEDARHLPKKGLIHIANTLAFRGLCDPIIPGAPDTDSLVRTFRKRMEQCVNAISRISPGRRLALFIDAIDNAQIVADQRSEEAFPVLLLNSLHQNPIEGVKLIVSCRTERKPPTFAECEELELRPFTLPETASYLRARMKPISEAQIQVAQSRSGGNGRILEYLAETGPELLAQSEIDKKLELESLLHGRIDKALSSAIERGYEQKDINAFLAGLAVLPPPVPIDEYAAAHGMEPSVIQSFAADLYPLLERTNQGITFRDEPTETLVRNEYSASKDLLKRVADNLFARQESSVYAATALPGLLHDLDDGERLFELALDTRIPSQITSTVGKRNVRYARLKAATLHAAIKNDYNKLVNLLVELSSIAAVDQKGVDYILSNPDLVVAAQDVDATRRLFETRTAWPGTRHARLTIAHCLRGDATEAYRHAVSADEWLRHYSRTRDNNRPDRAGPKQIDVAAIALLLIAEKRPADAQDFLHWWPDLYIYEVCEYIFPLLDLGVSFGSWPAARRSAFVKEIDAIGTLAAALSFQSLSKPIAQELCLRLAKRCRRATKLEFRDRISRNRTHQLEDGLRKSAAIALSLGLKKQALGISLRAPHDRPGLWSFRDSFSSQDIFGMLFRAALVSAATGQPIHEKDLLPRELKPICARIKKNLTGAAFREEAKKQVAKVTRSYREDEAPEGQKKGLSRDEGERANAFFDRRLESLLLLTRALAAFLAAPKGGGNREFVALIKAWESARKSRDPYRTQQLDDLFRNLGLEAALFALWARPELSPASVQRFLECLHAQDPHAPVLIRVVAILSRQKAHQSVAGQESIKVRALIDKEDDVAYKGSLYSDLGRAILPASVDEASANFRDGLEHMDAIGSGDYRFTNELLLFASSIKGDELDEQSFHTLTNINELNMGEETHKFYWRAYGSGMSKTSGIRGLAKLSRWDDRSKVELTYTLLPYLTALVEDGKIEPRDALILNRLAEPAEYFEAGTKLLAEVVDAAAKDDRPALLNELIGQYLDDNPGTPWDTTLEALAKLAETAFGNSELTQYLRAAGKRYGTVRNTRNERMNYRSDSDAWLKKRSDDTDKKNNEALKEIIGETDPLDELSLTKAVEGLNALERFYGRREQFFDPMREKIPYAKRSEYVKLIASLENLDFYPKLNELEKCHEIWAASSAALKGVYKEEAIPLVRRHADELIGDDSLSGYKLKQVSDLCGVAIADLVLELIKALARPDVFVSGAVWLAFGTFVCPRAEPGQGQEALKRLLASEAARLADKVTDGPWKKGLYPDNNIVDVASGLIWRMLGSPSANDRWRAAHSVRACARLGRWPIIDALVARLNDESLGPFNATELPFYYLHARLWLLIALARIAKDYPKEIAAYESGLLPFATEKSDPHVLTRHFAAQALLTCVDAGGLKLASKTVTELRNADSSPFQVVPRPAGGVAGYYAGRPKGSPPPYKFGIDYDFHKHDVDWLGRLFFKPTWQVADDIADLANKIDPNVENMYEDGGRERPGRRTSYGMTMRDHTYGEQIGWHAFLRTAGRLLTTVPVTKDQWEDDPWREWLRRYSLTHPEGWWLSDGTDRKPLDTAVFLLRRVKEKLVLTGDKQELLALARLGERVKNELVVEGDWYSADGVAVAVSSALVPPSKAATFARSVLREDPMIAWLPSLFASEEDDEYERSEKKEYTPWTVLLDTSAKLDEYDPYGVPQAASRPRLGRDFLSSCSLVTDDSFARFWHDKRGKVQLRAEVWGRKDDDREDGPHPGTRLFCSASSLKKVLKKFNKELLVLIRLRRYEKEGYRSERKYTHTVAVARINQSLDVEYFKGRVNHLHKARY